jgi:hypothetical protein
MAGRKPDSEYRPKKPNANLSEEEDDDFIDADADATASTSNVCFSVGLFMIYPVTVRLGPAETKGHRCGWCRTTTTAEEGLSSR